MTPNFLSMLWSAIAPALGNHLWQSTLVAAVAGLLTLALRKHHARARYWLWLAASAKFLIPFSLLVGVGSHLAWFHPPAPAAIGSFYFAVEQVSQPFTSSAGPIVVAPVVSTSLHWPNLLPSLLAVWLCGFLVVLFIWTERWRKISFAMQSAVPLRGGREVEALRRMERVGGIRKRIELLSSRASMEPGIFGITSPVLIWPEGISKHLEDAHLEAIVAHEVWHVRRQDNLVAALHMIVEAIFWFYPMVWWLGARLVEERERACDEEVVELGSDRQVYAESILKVCEFSLGSPLACVSGVTGADLKKRMVHIMTDRILHKLDFARKLLLSVAALLAIAIPVIFGLLHATPSHAQSQEATTSQAAPAFESVTVKSEAPSADVPRNSRVMFSLADGRLSASGVTLQTLIKMAYHIQDSQLSGGPDWLNTQRFAIDAKMNSAAAEDLRQKGVEHGSPENQGMLQALLRDHFKLAVHTATKTLPVYDLVADENGPKLQEASGMQRMMHLGKGELTSSGTPLSFLADQLSVRLARTVLDKTGLKGNYQYSLHWTPDPSEEEHLKADGMAQGPEMSAPEENGPPLLTALQQQLGLKLEPRNAPVQVLVIDRAEPPAEN